MQNSYRRKRGGFGLVRHNILQPVPVNTHGRGAPSTFQIASKKSFRKTFHELFSSIGQSDISEISQKFRRGDIKITLRHGRVSFSFRSEKSFYISPVFLQQSLRAILRMALEMHKQATLFVFHERIHPAFA